jgi:formylglycine-generating enzyme
MNGTLGREAAPKRRYVDSLVAPVRLHFLRSPINCVNWFEAYAFCIWDGGFLPSEAEWEYAAAGGSLQLGYPWGWTDPGTSNQYAIFGEGNGAVDTCYYPGPGLKSCVGTASVAPVGTATLGAGRWGQLDLAGEVLEWNMDWFAPYADPCTNCADFTASVNRISRGGIFFAPLFPAATRLNASPSERFDSVGFRCSRSP